MKKYFDLDLKENDAVNYENLEGKLVVPAGFKKKLNFIELEQLLNMQLLENGLRMDGIIQAGGSRVIKASKNFKITGTSDRLREYLDKFEEEQK